ncbi:MAG: hypothetical protein E7515_07140 [Ruminococcaceae bacterium]|nr:hypothetical protein [Oscillospiraceae bacterium]
MKKIIIAVSVVLAITVVACVGTISYHNRYYSLSANVAVPVEDGDGNPINCVTLRKEGKSYFCSVFIGGAVDKVPKEQLEYMKTVNKDIEEYVKEVYSFEKPYFIESKYENRDNGGKTVITFKGEVTNPETGELEDYEKVFMYPFIVTKDIQNLEPAATNYFND